MIDSGSVDIDNYARSLGQIHRICRRGGGITLYIIYIDESLQFSPIGLGVGTLIDIVAVSLHLARSRRSYLRISYPPGIYHFLTCIL